MLLVARVRRTLLERGLIPRGAGVVVGTSGGPDSTALLDVLVRLSGELGLRLVAVGVDHGLREAAGRELDLAEGHAQRRGVPFQRIQVVLDPAESVHAAARAARYAALQAVAAERGATRIAIGHTLDDQAETVLARVLRGSGLRGLGGIDPARADGVVRPLLDASRAEVRDYLAENGIAFAEDPSNADPRFERSRIRHEILPALAREDVGAVLHLARLADEAREADDALEAMAQAALADASGPDGVSLSVLRRAPGVVALRALRRALGPGLGRSHLSELAAWLQSGVGSRVLRLPGAATARIVGDHVVITRALGRDSDEEA